MTVKTTPTDRRPKPAVQNHKIQNGIGLPDWEFTGIQIGNSTTYAPYKTQWTEMRLYRVTKGPNNGLYVLEVVGCSDAYHRVKAECKGSQNGDVIPSSDLPEEAKPCPKCRPGVQGKDTLPETVALELDWPQLSECATPADVINTLKDGAEGKISNPAQRLLIEAAENDPDMNTALHRVRKI